MLLTIELSHQYVAATRFELAFEAYETSELAITLNRIFCWPEQVRTVNLERIRFLLLPLSYGPLLAGSTRLELVSLHS